MAAMIGNFGCADPSPFHSRISSSGIPIAASPHQPEKQQQQQQQQQQTTAPSHRPQSPLPFQRNSSQSRYDPMLSAIRSTSQTTSTASKSIPSATTHPVSPPLSSSNSFASTGQATPAGSADGITGRVSTRIPTPPDSSPTTKPPSFLAPSAAEARVIVSDVNNSTSNSLWQSRNGCLVHPMASTTVTDAAQLAATSSASSASIAVTGETGLPTPRASRPPPPTNAIPSPASDSAGHWMSHNSTSLPTMPSNPAASSPYAATLPPALAPPPPEQQRLQRTIMIRDLDHIRSLTQANSSATIGGVGGGGGFGGAILNEGDTPLQDVKFEISAMPIGDIIEMVAALLTKITTTNDQQHDALHRNATQQRQAQAHNNGTADTTHATTTSPFSASVLAFHGKNVPAITILSYLSRIHKYCPTTYEVFLSLLVYFDRMTERVNELVMKQQQEQQQQQELRLRRDILSNYGSRPEAAASGSGPAAGRADVVMHDADNSGSIADETDEDLADSSDDDGRDGDGDGTNPEHGSGGTGGQPMSGVAPSVADISPMAATYFVVDSYNIHRLIIAGVTCASKFFSDVFYTNSRYAKVGGLPLAELNHLELQFLILNDFRLAIPIEDLEAYATMLVEFYAREVVGQRPRPSSAS